MADVVVLRGWADIVRVKGSGSSNVRVCCRAVITLSEWISSSLCLLLDKVANFIVVILHDLPIEGAFFRPGEVILDSIPVDP
jgi:hypothetical protein